jgi:Skp family chaperone for outer membrane proteins
MGCLRHAGVVAALICLAAAASAQEAPAPTPAPVETPVPAAPPLQSAILTVDLERLYGESLWGKRALAELEDASRALQAENRRIEAQLTAEEKALTNRRPDMPAAEFRKLADEFDTRVTGIREAQDAKARDLTRQRDADRQAFLDAALPLMGEVMRSRGAVAILDNRAIFLSVKAIDATDDIRARIDAGLGPGPAAPAPAVPAPGGD